MAEIDELIAYYRAWASRNSGISIAGQTADALARLQAENERLRDAARFSLAAAASLEGYERDCGEVMPDHHEVGRVEDSRHAPSFRIRVGHIRRLAAALSTAPTPAESVHLTEHEQKLMEDVLRASVKPVRRITPAESGETRADGWREIETDPPPKDGTPVDLWSGMRWPDCFWGVPGHCCGESGQYCDSDWHRLEPGWVNAAFNEMLDIEPTHWRFPPLTPAEEPRNG